MLSVIKDQKESDRDKNKREDKSILSILSNEDSLELDELPNTHQEAIDDLEIEDVEEDISGIDTLISANFEPELPRNVVINDDHFQDRLKDMEGLHEAILLTYANFVMTPIYEDNCIDVFIRQVTPVVEELDQSHGSPYLRNMCNGINSSNSENFSVEEVSTLAAMCLASNGEEFS